MAKEIKTIGVMTSGGDAPGMNAAIRAVVRAALSSGLEVKGIRRGYAGLLEEDIIGMHINNIFFQKESAVVTQDFWKKILLICIP